MSLDEAIMRALDKVILALIMVGLGVIAISHLPERMTCETYGCWKRITAAER